MAKFEVTRPEGKFEVEADSPDEAGKMVDAEIRNEAVAKSRQSLQEAPMWAKPFMYADSAAKTFADTATLGRLAPLVGDEAGVAAARDRLGVGTIPFDILGGMTTPGIGIPAAAAKIGGGALMRGLVKGAGAGLHGGIVGGLQAGQDDQPLSGRVAQGALSGVLGQTAAGIVGKGINKAGKMIKGVDDALPPASLSNFPNKAPSPARRVETAAIKTEQAGGDQKTASKVFGMLKPKGFKPDELAGIDRVVKGDPGTNAAAKLGKYIDEKAMMANVGAGLTDWKMLLGTMVGLPAASALVKKSSNMGTKESIDELRRLMLKKPKQPGMLSPEMIDRLGRGNQRAIMQQLLEDEE